MSLVRVYVSFTTYFWLLSNFLCGPLEQSCGRMLWVEGMSLGLFPVSSLNPLLAPLMSTDLSSAPLSLPGHLSWRTVTLPHLLQPDCPWYEGHHAPWWIPALSGHY